MDDGCHDLRHGVAERPLRAAVPDQFPRRELQRVAHGERHAHGEDDARPRVALAEHASREQLGGLVQPELRRAAPGRALGNGAQPGGVDARQAARAVERRLELAAPDDERLDGRDDGAAHALGRRAQR